MTEREEILAKRNLTKCPKCGRILVDTIYPGFCLYCAMKEIDRNFPSQSKPQWNPSRR